MNRRAKRLMTPKERQKQIPYDQWPDTPLEPDPDKTGKQTSKSAPQVLARDAELE